MIIFNETLSPAWLTKKRSLSMAGLLLLMGSLISAKPAFAHHPFGGETPDTALAGFLSGLGHPVIGFDHFVFVIAVGLLAALQRRGMVVPAAFILMSLAGTGIHLMGVDLPAPELVISASVLLFGALLALKDRLNEILVIGLGAIAGIFHGYAYGEAIVGAEMTSLMAYLVGFSLIQLMISLSAYFLGRRVTENGKARTLPLRFAGFAICGIGIALLNGLITG
ncbi:hypothetical protein C1752_02297 [Acaryochloris thomasi RCC1774]|uniref:HupE / UreJ protein n=1 Tax=Acaryochloris thomasi RCC1774 TaxID=1764569 RepID=A0A2W1JR29_9CYAN|nr:HupE/UreJ family protein [Acaryochloris thomasi]PZD73292.1 hypothetical protein C1752_02297 [Acaryochloris thomasi RCC1774]